MKRALSLISLVAVGVLFAAAKPRPGSALAQEQMLNGVPRRWTLPDAGQSILIAASGQACADVTGICTSVVLLVPEQPTNLCVQPGTGATGANVWDGGCNTIDTDPNFGVPLQAWVPQYVILETGNTQICAASDAGALRVPLFCQY
jgi:hypothetical protein